MVNQYAEGLSSVVATAEKGREESLKQWRRPDKKVEPFEERGAKQSFASLSESSLCQSLNPQKKQKTPLLRTSRSHSCVDGMKTRLLAYLLSRWLRCHGRFRAAQHTIRR